MFVNIKIIFLLFLYARTVHSWDNEQLEIFDLVEEINENFYTLLNVSHDANSSSIRTAFRRLSLVLHPDKNSAPNADEQFRNLVAVYDVLKDGSKREKYNDVLVNGLPSWRSAVYYYRHVRKMGLAEASIILFIIITVGQYIVSWASYWEKKYTAEQILSSKIKDQRRTNKRQILDSILDEIPKPSLRDTLPFQIPRLLWAVMWALPSVLSVIAHGAAKQVQEAMARQEEPEPEVVNDNEQPKAARRRKNVFTLPEGPNFETQYSSTEKSNNAVDVEQSTAPLTGGLWTDDDLAELIQLVKKFPGGAEGRWEKIASAVGRSVPEVTYMANKMKENGYRVPGQQEQEEVPAEPIQKQKTKGGKIGAGQTESVWNQTQQQALEIALAKYPKGPADRWEKIAKCIPDKTKEECMLRYKHLVEMIRKQKEGPPTAESPN